MYILCVVLNVSGLLLIVSALLVTHINADNQRTVDARSVRTGMIFGEVGVFMVVASLFLEAFISA